MSRRQRSAPHYWSDEEDATLLAMRRAGGGVNDIARHLQLPAEVVYSRCKRLLSLGLLRSRKPEKWSSAELSLLTDGSLTNAEIAKRVGRTPGAVSIKRVANGITQRTRWAAAEEEQLIGLRSSGVNFKSIGVILGRSASAITNHVSLLIRSGKIRPLAQDERSRRGAKSYAESRPDKWTDTERRQLVAYWAAGLTAGEIAGRLGARSRLAINNELMNLRQRGILERLPRAEAQARSNRIQQMRKATRYKEAITFLRAMPNRKSAGYVIGVLYGDGFISTQGDRGSIGLKSTNSSFCEAFAAALEETFGRKAKLLSRIEPIKEIGGYVYRNVRYFEAFLHSVHLGKAIREVFGPTDEMSWCANREYMIGIGTSFVDGVIQGFFDAEGSFMRDARGRFSTTACSMNERGLRSIHALLLARQYRASVSSDHRKQWRVGIHRQSEVWRFATEIGSRIDY